MPRLRAITVVTAFLTVGAVGELRGQIPLQWMAARQQSLAHAQPMAHDIGRGRTVLFGRDELGAPTTWELKGARWSQRVGITNPPQRGAHALAYDAERRRVVLFGGSGAMGILGDTWEYDGADWRNTTSSAGPAALRDAAMAFDYNAQRIVLFGGADVHGFTQAETWEWDGIAWTQRFPTASPPPRYLHGMCSDVARQRIVVVGGQSNATYHSDTWEWDGGNWSLRSTSSPGGNWRAMTYDAQRARCVLFGGGSGFISSDTWEWNGTAWSLRTPPTRPPARFAHTLAYDFDQQRTVLFGGISSGSVPLSDTWGWDGADWQLLHRNVRHGRGVYDPLRQVVVASAGDARVLEWDGVAWKEQAFASGPAPRNWFAITFDSVRQRLVLFGGTDGNSAPLDDLWEWDGTAWQSPNPLVRPGPRTNHALAYDASRQRSVMFGGETLGETWEWDGTAWYLRQPASSPPARFGCTLAYDPVRQETLLFGGGTFLSYMTDTWVWDGTNWQQRTPTVSPGGRQGAGMDYDPVRQRVVLCGGQRISFTYPYTLDLDDTWEWDGSQWTQPAVVGRPAAGPGSLVVDHSRQRVNWLGREHSILGQLQPASVSSSGNGCGGTFAPLLQATTPSLGNPEVLVDLLDGPPSSFALLVFAFQTQTLPVGGGCTVLVANPVFSSLVATNASGFAVTGFAVQNAPWLRGVAANVQGAMLDNASPIGLALTARLRLMIGD